MATCPCGATFDLPIVQHGKVKKYCGPRCSGRFRMRDWRESNPGRAAEMDAKQDERRRVLNAAHPERSKAREAARYAADPAGHRARVAQYRSIPENRKRSNAATAAWIAANPDRQRASRLRWEAENPELVAHYQAAWRARKRGNGGSHTLTQWRDKCAAFGNRCAYCGESKPLTKDHDVPLSRGGTDDIENIVPACRLCNSKKRTRTRDEYLQLHAVDISAVTH